MRYTVLTKTSPWQIVLGCLFLFAGCQPRPAGSIHQLKARIYQFNLAFEKGEADILAQMITDRYIHTNGASEAINKDSWLTYLKKREAEIKFGHLQVLAYQMDAMQIELYDQTAIVTGKVLVTEKREITVTQKSYYVTHVWVVEDGMWKRAGFHDGKVL